MSDAVETGHAWVLLNWKLQVFSRPKWNDKLTVNTWSSKHTFVAYYRDFEVYDERKNLVAIATSKWVFYDFKNGTFAKFDESSHAKFEIVDKHVFEGEIKEKLIEPKNVEISCQYTVIRRDIDTNHHVNNLNYINFAYEVLPDDVFYNTDFKNIEIMYKHEAKLGDVLNLLYSKQNDSTLITIKNKDNTKIHCIIKLY